MSGSNGTPATAFEAKLAKLKAERAAKVDAGAVAREARDTAELDAVFATIDKHDGTWDDNVLQVKDAPPELAGHVVLRRPSKAELARYRSIVMRANVANPERGALEARAKASGELAQNCVVYPDFDGFQKLTEFAPGVVDNAFVIVMRLAEGGARDDAKK